MAKGIWGGNLKVFEKQLKSQLNAVEDNLYEQATKALDLVEETSQRLVPIDTGRTHQSFFRYVEIDGDTMKLVAGYDEKGELKYVPFIHENPAGLVWQREGAESQFLQKGFLNNEEEIFKILKVDPK